MFNCSIKTIPIKDMRTNVIGDYWTEGGVTQFRVANMANANMEFLVAIHHLIEKQLAREEGVTEQMIEAWDLLHEGVDDPAMLPDCPYHRAFETARAITRVVAIKLGIDWDRFLLTQKRVLNKQLPPA